MKQDYYLHHYSHNKTEETEAQYPENFFSVGDTQVILARFSIKQMTVFFAFFPL